MDQLSTDAMEAKRLGLSYGKYIALYHPEKPPVERRSKKNARGQEKRPLCVICGEPIPASSNRKKYCSPACADQAMQEQRRAANQRRREARELQN